MTTPLAKLAYPDGTIAIAAFDHRNSLFELLNPQNPSTVSASAVVALKRLFLAAFGDISSAVLIDPVYGLDYGIDLSRELPPGVGLLLSLEESSYDESAIGRLTRLLPHWGVSDIQKLNATAKLLLYYHPKAPIAQKQLELVGAISRECRQSQVPFLIEPILYGIGDFSTATKLALTLEVIDQLNPLVDILKLEFPLNVKATAEKQWVEAARCINEHARVPWILLSRGMPYEPFKSLTAVCCEAGASGIAVGRAVWQEIESIAVKNSDFPDLVMPRIEEFLMTEGRLRMRELIAIVHQSAHPWNR